MIPEKSCFAKIILTLAMIVYLFIGVIQADSSHSLGLFTEVSDTDKHILLDDPRCIRSRLVELNKEFLCLLQSADCGARALERLIELNLFDDVYLIANIKEIRPTFSQGYAYVGTIEGEPDSEVILILHSNMLTGNINIPGYVFQVRPASDGLLNVQEIDPSGFPTELPPVPVKTAVKDFQPNLPDTAKYIDILVVYTEAACSAAKGTAAIESLIDLAITESNVGFANSDVNHRFRLVHTSEVVYNEKNFNWNTTLDRLQLPSDTYMDGVHQLRDTYGADVVVLIVENQDYCGIAFLMTQLSLDFEEWAFAVVNRECATGYYTFAHEIGHNMGSHHDRANAEGSGVYSYSYGYQAPDGAFRTIMAYDCQPSCPRVNFWSNPQKKHSGQPMGVDSSSPMAADNRKSLNNTAFTVANFRQQSSTSTITITSPNGGENWLAGSIQDITWVSAGFNGNVKIEYSINNGTSWATITSSTSNTGTYAWTIPAVSSSLCLVRVQAADVGIPSDVSDAVFFIYQSGSSPVIHLNQTRLDFTAIIKGSQTGTQQIWINNSGGGSLNWSISKDAAWLNCSPSSGTGGTVATVSVNPLGLGIGNYLASLKVSATGAPNSPQTVVVGLAVKSATKDSSPFGSFDTPIDGSTVVSSIPVTGWVLDDVEVNSVKIFNANSYLGDAVFVDGARPDVEQAFPGYPKNYRAGWGYMLLTYFLPNGGNGIYTLFAKAYDGGGHETVLGSKVITIQNINAVKPFGAIDTPSQGGLAQGGSYVNWGWVLTPQPNSIPPDGSTINVLVDGINLGHPVYNNYRKDIASLFPDYANSNGAVGYFYLDTTALHNGVHTIQWTATDSAGNTDGIGSRYFTVNNSGSDASISKVIGRGRGVIGNLSDIQIEKAEPIFFKRGYSTDATIKKEFPGRDGVVSLHIKELEPLRVYLGGNPVLNISQGIDKDPSLINSTNHFEAYLVVGQQYRSLPPGCVLKAKRGVLFWLPGPGILGKYSFIVVKNGSTGVCGKFKINIEVLPKFNKH
jgi:hypothetical protein